MKENKTWTQLSDDFREVAHQYKDGKFDYRAIWKWFQNQQHTYSLEKRDEYTAEEIDQMMEKYLADNPLLRTGKVPFKAYILCKHCQKTMLVGQHCGCQNKIIFKETL